MNGYDPRPVVAGIDGSDEAQCAADYGAWEAAHRGASLRLVYARRPMPLWGPATPLMDEYGWEQEWVRTLLSKTTAELKDAHPDLLIEATAISGRAAGVLVGESSRAGLVVVGTRAAGGLRGHLSASVAVQVAAHASCPLVAVRGIPGRRCDASAFADRPVVVGLDGSEHSQAAVAYAVQQAVDRDVPLRAVLVWSLFDIDDARAVSAADSASANDQQRSERLLSEALAGWSERYPDLRVTLNAIHDLDPVNILVEQSRDAGLVVVGSRGEGGFLGLRLGSTVDGLIRNAHCPIAVVHPGDVEIR
jgi:nucleotide-binding universal stress UspA family protein